MYKRQFFTLPVNGEPYITKNYTAIQQQWCENLTINNILSRDGNFKKTDDYPPGKRPVFLKNIAIEYALSDFTTSCQKLCGKTVKGCLRVIETKIENMNAYGRIVHKKARGCSNFYMLLSFEDRKEGWDSACHSME